MADAEKVLVIGSNSFSGASFIDYLLRLDIPVIGCSRSPEAHRAFLPYRWSGRDAHFQFHQFDLNHDLDPLTDLINEARPHYVVNFAAQSDGVSADKIIDRLIASTPTKEDELTSDARFKKIFAS